MFNTRFSAVRLACMAATAMASMGHAHASVLYFDFNQNTIGNTANASVFLFGAPGQTATVSNLSGFSQNVTLDANGFFNVPIANIYQQGGTGIKNTGFEIDSGQAIAGYFINRAGFSTDMTYLLDSNALGKEYVVASQGGGFGEGSQVAIHAISDNTVVTFTPSVGVAQTVTLQAGQTFKYSGGSANLTGSFVSADKAVAVFSGHECAQVPVGTAFCDTLLEQAIPTDKLSTSYLLTASKGAALAATQSDLVRVIATADGTEVKLNGLVVATLNKGQVYEFSLANNAGAKIDSSKPVAVAQYLKGGQGQNTDPAMSYVPGSDTWLKSYRLATPTGSAAFVINYASIVMQTADLGSLTLNGASVNTAGFTPIAGTTFSRGSVDLPLGLYSLAANSEFLAMLGGGSNADSYFTYGGSTFAPGISEPPPPPPPNGVPEPGSLALFATALAALAATRRRQKNQA